MSLVKRSRAAQDNPLVRVESEAEAVRARVIAQANAQVPDVLRRLTPEQHRERLKSLLPRVGFEKYPGKDWAQRILKRHAVGEPVELRALEMAQEVAELYPMREPGQDDEEAVEKQEAA